MKCTDIQEYLDDYIDETASSVEREAVDSHLDYCTSCRQVLAERKAVRQALASLPVVEASPGFETRVFSAVHRQYGAGIRKPGNRFIAGFATAMAVSLALWFASTLYTPQFEEQAPQMINLAINQTRTVKLVFETPTDLADVTLTVELPGNIELEGYGGQKQLVWQTSLTRGQNILALPIIATGNGQGELMAQLNYGAKTKQFHIVLKTTDGGAQNFQIIEFKSA
ncbi:MAG: zf-HC2 domain-containing protein [Gammaproteobacteria bacterium]|nr:zf-HC2 domain-containing protein [Gammaproteobacteria bacterium]